MESKAEQVKALLWEYDSVRSITTNEIAQRIDALYNSPEVPQQVVCPKHEDGCIFYELKPEDCPACYPVKFPPPLPVRGCC